MPHASHGHVVDIFNVVRVDGVDAVPDGSMDGFVGTFGSSGGSKEKHIKVEEKPPEGGEVNGECICIGDGLNSVGLWSEKVQAVAVFEVTAPCGSEVGGVMIVVV